MGFSATSDFPVWPTHIPNAPQPQYFQTSSIIDSFTPEIFETNSRIKEPNPTIDTHGPRNVPQQFDIETINRYEADRPESDCYTVKEEELADLADEARFGNQDQVVGAFQQNSHISSPRGGNFTAPYSSKPELNYEESELRRERIVRESGPDGNHCAMYK